MTSSPSKTPRVPPWVSHVLMLVVLLYFGTVFRGVLFLTQGAPERDSFYHARYAQLLPERGLSRQLPWMQFTSWRDQFCDKDFLYHVYLAPFCTNAAEPLDGAKYATLLLLLATLAGTYFVLRAWKAPFALVWTALLASGGAYFLTRMFMVRSHTLSVVLMVVAVHLALKRCKWGVFILGFVYSWTYSTPIALVIAVTAAECGRLAVARDRNSLTLPLVAAAGVLAGLVVHPYTPYSLTSMAMFFQIIWSGATTSPVELGSEFRRMTLGAAFVSNGGTTCAALLALAGALALRAGALRNRKLSPEAAAAVGIACAWTLAMMVTFERFIEYAAPCACIALGLVVRDLLGDLDFDDPERPNRRTAQVAALGGAVVVLLVLHMWTLELNYAYLRLVEHDNFNDDAQLFYRGRYFDGAAAWLKRNVPPKTVVANFYWDDFPELFYSAPEMYYLVGLDPTFMRLAYPDKALLVENMRLGKTPFDFATLRRTFGTKFVVLRTLNAAKFPELRSEAAKARVVFSDALAVIYRCD